jgi:hypothetical protein
MRNLKELVHLIHDNRLENISIFTIHNRKENNNYNKIFDAILNNKIETDDDGAKLLYGAKDEDVRYRVFKKRFRERLYNSILFIDTGKRSTGSYHEVYHDLSRKLLVAKSLIGVSLKQPGYSLLKTVLKKAEEFHYFDVVMDCAVYFRRQMMMEGNEAEFIRFNNLYNSAMANLNASNSAEFHYYKVMIKINQSSAQTHDLIVLAKQSFDVIEMLRRTHPVYQVRYYASNMANVYYQLVHQFDKALESSNEFESFLLSNKVFYSKATHANILTTKASCYLNLKAYEDGIKAAKQALNLYSEGSENWFLVMELYFLMLINSRLLKEAVDTYIQIIEHERFEYMRPVQVEMWRILGGYLNFLLHFEQNKKLLEKVTKHAGTFRLSKLINEIPNFAKDKKGMNVAVLILQILNLLFQKDYIKIISRTEALKSYIYRNLKKDDAYRSHYFVKMILTMEKTNFESESTKEQAQIYLNEMQKLDIVFNASQTRLEIIPYETLWEMILQMLRKE